jgi:ABC-2 type transport system ATP-binding protein
MTAISTRALTKRFGKVTAVDQLSIKIPSGSLFGLIGPNGAGKTTTLRMLAGLLEPDDGEIRINELSLKQYWREIQWQIGYMPDFFGVYDDLLVWEYLDFFGRCFRIEPARRKQTIDELLELVDLTEKRDSYIHTLSRGMRQRLCLAHALINDPQVLLLDEPASGLDPRARVEMRELLRELGNMNKTILLSSHILSELVELCDQIAIMERGHLVTSGPINEVLSRAKEHRTFAVQILNDSERAQNLIQDFPTVLQVHTKPSRDGVSCLEIDFQGSDQEAADLLERLIMEKNRVVAFNETSTNLEDAFLRLTKGEVA